ncbi:MAG TPA: RodZ domain-containing protein [Bryobacteraceae bacterium]|jgi:cytoskeletal protein RodZ|nr:RodZ domain-containing protein [Bryobacteraceae bacterium]
MESVGQKLRTIRLQRGLTLEDISAKTRISTRNLQAIERDDLSPIGSSFFYKSFVRQFAQQLSLDYSELAAAVQSLSSTLPEPLMPGQLASGVTLPSVPALRPRRRKRLRWLYSFTSLIVMLVGCSTLYSLWQNSRSSLQTKISGFVSSLRDGSAEPRKTTAISNVPQISQAPREPVDTADTTPSAPQPDAAFRVELSAIERTWLSIVADGQETFTGVLETAETKVLEGRETARIRMGNAGGLNVVFNGRAIGSLGPRGQVRTVVFTRTGYETFEPSTAPAAHLTIAPFIPNGE